MTEENKKHDAATCIDCLSGIRHDDPMASPRSQTPEGAPPAYQDPAITTPQDQEQHLILTDSITAMLRSQGVLRLISAGWLAEEIDRDHLVDSAFGLTDRVLREAGWFRIRKQELDNNLAKVTWGLSKLDKVAVALGGEPAEEEAAPPLTSENKPE